jgi:lambda repressor-like predicted transcriptional regulator
MKLDVFAIKLLVAENEMSIAELSEKAGCYRNALSNIFRKGTCTPKTAGRLAHAFGVPVEAIVIKE